jgi:hypothetical protein
MGVSLLQDVAQWAGATAVLAFVGCLIAGALAVQMSASPLLPGEEAYGLARAMAVLGGASVLVACSSSALYYWSIGVASGRAAVLIEAGLLVAATAFAGVLRLLVVRSRARASR